MTLRSHQATQGFLTIGDSPQDYLKLVKYFMASLTVPEGDLWVNLSPYEPDRIVPDALGQTEMGRDLLAQDYILKQLTASLMSPEGEAGERFWNKIYERIYETGAVPVSQGTVPFDSVIEEQTRAVPVSTHHAQRTTDQIIESFNKVWIVPDEVEVYQNGDTAYITKATLKVMLESDYLAEVTSNEKRVTGTKEESSRYPLPVTRMTSNPSSALQSSP